MQLLVEPVARLIDEFSRLPGIGPKTSARIVFHLLRAPEEQAHALADALLELRQRTVFCSVCHNITEADPCAICTDEGRDRSLICVVEEPLDVIAIERTRDYHGLYHVLHGTLAPVEGIGPDDLHIADLLPRLNNAPPVREVIIATNPNMEGEATAMYVARQLATANVRITRLARGLPMGGDLEYADQITLSRALAGRQAME
jgi:recombination protein RecR